MKDVNVGSPDKSTKSESAEVWDLSQERAFIENLLCQRFNFLLVFYSLVVAGAFTANSQRNFNIVLTIGAIVSSMFALPIARAHHKLELILRHLGTRHPARMTDVWASDLSLVPTVMRPFVRYSRRDVIGYWIPLLCAVSLWIGAVLGWGGAQGGDRTAHVGQSLLRERLRFAERVERAGRLAP